MSDMTNSVINRLITNRTNQYRSEVHQKIIELEQDIPGAILHNDKLINKMNS